MRGMSGWSACQGSKPLCQSVPALLSAPPLLDRRETHAPTIDIEGRATVGMLADDGRMAAALGVDEPVDRWRSRQHRLSHAPLRNLLPTSFSQSYCTLHTLKL